MAVKHIESQYVETPGQKRPTGTATPSKMVQGCTINDLCAIFAMDRRSIIPRIGGVKPCGKRGNFPLYQIRDVAPYIVKPAFDIEEYMQKMRPQDLPPLLSKEYWNGQRARQAYEENNGDLWRTDKVIEALGGVFKTLRMHLLLIPDAIERRTTISETQRQMVRDEIDAALSRIGEALVSEFEGNDFRPGIHDDQQEQVEEDDDFFHVPDLGADDEDDEDDDEDDL